MEFTRNSPIKFSIKPISGSTMVLKLIIKGSKNITKIDISVIIYCRHPIHCNMINCVSSDIINLYSNIKDKAYEVKIGIPEFKDIIESFMLFQIDRPGEKAYIEEIDIIGFTSEKISFPIIEEVPIPKSPTMEEMIDHMIDQYGYLPKDLKNRISYIYPVLKNDSFHVVASNHIKYLKYRYLTNNEHIDIDEIDWCQLGYINWSEKRNILLHPFLYPFVPPESSSQNSKNFAKLLGMKNKIGGFDVADSNRISQTAVELINKIDLMMVPSKFAKDAYIDSGVYIPVEILPHGVPDEFLSDDPVSTDNIDIIKLKRMKEGNNILVLYFLIHSNHRKGADLVRDVMRKVQSKFGNVYLIIKGRNTDYFSGLRTINIGSWMNNNDLRLLYDTCDICLSPSRGGGFELNAIEAVSRGVPTLVTNGCCFLDMMDYFIPINLDNKMVQPLPGNPIHVGYGCEIDIKDFEAKLIDVINRLEHWKGYFRRNMVEIREKYSWRSTARSLDEYLKLYGFIGQ